MNKMKRGAGWRRPVLGLVDVADRGLNSPTPRPACRPCGRDDELAVRGGLAQPVKLPLFVNAQLGFMAVYLLADYDDLARKLILAHHTALIDRSTLERWLNDGAHALRSLFCAARPAVPLLGHDARRLRGEERRGASGAGSSASCRKTCWKARAARASRHRSRGRRPNPARRLPPAIEPDAPAHTDGAANPATN